MKTYHKIQSVFKRDPVTNNKNFLIGEYSLPEFEFLKGNVWVFTEKVNGTNIRVMWDGNDVTFGGKTDNAQIPSKLIEQLNGLFYRIDRKQKLEEIFSDGEVCLYGEGYGAGIQSGGNYKAIQDFVLFDVKIGDWWLKREDVEDVAKKLDLDIVPILGEGTLEEMVQCAKVGIASTWGSFQAEGIVARPKVELKTRSGDRIITKIKCKDFN